ncbi:MAG: right-handed parallel beta-helix repeat-containing protein [Planctomycetota bacterium]
MYRTLLIAIVSGFALESALFAATIRVPADHATIQEAINASSTGDEIVVSPGEYGIDAPITFGGRGITLRSEQGAAVTTLRGTDHENSGSIFSLDDAEPPEAIIDGFTISDTEGTIRTISVFGGPPFMLSLGAGIYIGTNSEPLIRNCVFRNLTADNGAAAFCDLDSQPRFENCEFRNNILPYKPELFSVQFGGCISAAFDSLITVSGSRFENNVGLEGAGIGARAGSTVHVTDCEFVGNRSIRGGAIGSRSAILTIENSKFTRNGVMSGVETQIRSYQGGALYFWASGNNNDPVKITNCEFDSNFANNEGGAIYTDTTGVPFENLALIDGCRFADNLSNDGGGVFVEYGASAVKFQNSTFENNRALRNGGAVNVLYDTETLYENCAFQGNTASEGGAVRVQQGDAEFSRVTMAANAAGAGGGILNVRGQISIDRSV